MDNFSEILKKRSVPGVLIFDREDRLLYFNREALEILASRNEGEDETLAIPAEVYDLCHKISGSLKRSDDGGDAGPACRILTDGEKVSFSLRVLPLGGQGGADQPTHLMVLLERVVERHEVDIDAARERFHLTRREGEIIRLIGRGLANREIAETLFISEHTVKDHVKNIMRKINAGSRNEIIALLL